MIVIFWFSGAEPELLFLFAMFEVPVFGQNAEIGVIKLVNA